MSWALYYVHTCDTYSYIFYVTTISCFVSRTTNWNSCNSILLPTYLKHAVHTKILEHVTAEQFPSASLKHHRHHHHHGLWNIGNLVSLLPSWKYHNVSSRKLAVIRRTIQVLLMWMRPIFCFQKVCKGYDHKFWRSGHTLSMHPVVSQSHFGHSLNCISDRMVRILSWTWNG